MSDINDTASSAAEAFSLKDQTPHLQPRTIGEFASDRIAAIVGSWRFILIQSGLLALWLVLNVVGAIQHWDPYPFILLNLVLSFQAAFTAPIIMMAQNRQSDIDRCSLPATQSLTESARPRGWSTRAWSCNCSRKSVGRFRQKPSRITKKPLSAKSDAAMAVASG